MSISWGRYIGFLSVMTVKSLKMNSFVLLSMGGKSSFLKKIFFIYVCMCATCVPAKA